MARVLLGLRKDSYFCSGLSNKRCQQGQGMTEYIIIVALISVAAVAAYQFLGQVIRSQTAAMAKELAGEDGTAQIRSAKTAADGAVGQTTRKTLKTYSGNNTGASR